MSEFKAIPADLLDHLASRAVPAAKGWRSLFGKHVPKDFARHKPQDGGFLLASPDMLLGGDDQASGEANSFVAALQAMTDEGRVEPLLQVLTMTYFLNEIPGDGDCLMAHIPSKGDTAQVVVWQHETGDFSEPVASDIPSALRVIDVSEGVGADGELSDRLAPALSRVDADRWPFRYITERLVEDGLCTVEEARGYVRPKSGIVRFQGRVWWICDALRGRRIEHRDLKALGSSNPDAAIKGRNLATYPPTALYWLLRSYLLDEEWLERILEKTRASKSRLIADASALIDELVAGKRTSAGGVNFAAAKARACEEYRKATDPFPPQVVAGGLTFDRVDVVPPALLEDQEPAKPETLPEPAPDQPMDPRWGAAQWAYVGESSVAGRVLVQGHRRHNRLNKHVECLMEIDEAGVVTMALDFSQAKTCVFIDDDTFLVANISTLFLCERRGRSAVITNKLAGAQMRTFQVNHGHHDGRTLLRSGGYATGVGNPHVFRTISVLRIDGRHPRHEVEVELALSHVREVDGEHYAGDPAKSVWYRISGLDSVAANDPETPALRPSNAIVEQQPPRTGPDAALEGLNPMGDWAYGSAGGQALILQHVEGTNFRVLVGDDAGRRPAEPNIEGKLDHRFCDDTTSVLFLENGEAWCVDLTTAKATKLGATHPDDLWDQYVLPNRGLVQVVGDELVLDRPSDGGDPATTDLSTYTRQTIKVGDGAKVIATIVSQQVIALSTANSPLVLLSPGPDVRLLGAIDPAKYPGLTVEMYQNPRCHYRIQVEHAGKKLTVHGLARALNSLESYPTVDGELPAEPWKLVSI